MGVQVDVTAAEAAGLTSVEPQVDSVKSLAMQQLGAGWGRVDPWVNIRSGMSMLKPHKAQVSRSLSLTILFHQPPSRLHVTTTQIGGPCACALERRALR